jgi:hypothetical protein
MSNWPFGLVVFDGLNNRSWPRVRQNAISDDADLKPISPCLAMLFHVLLFKAIRSSRPSSWIA